MTRKQFLIEAALIVIGFPASLYALALLAVAFGN